MATGYTGRRILLATGLVLALSACGDRGEEDYSYEDYSYEPSPTPTSSDSYNPHPRKITVDGVECVVTGWPESDTPMTLSCNWDGYNASKGLIK